MATSETPARLPRRLPVLVVILLLGFALVGVIGGGGSLGACAAPPPGMRSVTPLWVYAWFLGPALLVFLISAYYALGIRNIGLRLLALVPCLALASVAAFAAILFMPFSCGEWVPA